MDTGYSTPLSACAHLGALACCCLFVLTRALCDDVTTLEGFQTTRSLLGFSRHSTFMPGTSLAKAGSLHQHEAMVT